MSAEIELLAFLRLGQLAGEYAEGPEFEASISAAYALGAEERYGSVPLWSTLQPALRKRVYAQLYDCPVALEKLRSCANGPVGDV